MQKAFEILKGRPKIEIILTRDAVCAGDDSNAPHEKTITTYSFTDPKALAREVSSGYLPSVAGTGHSWICRLNDVKIAEIETSEIRALVRNVIFSENNRIHFTYVASNH